MVLDKAYTEEFIYLQSQKSTPFKEKVLCLKEKLILYDFLAFVCWTLVPLYVNTHILQMFTVKWDCPHPGAISGKAVFPEMSWEAWVLAQLLSDSIKNQNELVC